MNTQPNAPQCCWNAASQFYTEDGDPCLSFRVMDTAETITKFTHMKETIMMLKRCRDFFNQKGYGNMTEAISYHIMMLEGGL